MKNLKLGFFKIRVYVLESFGISVALGEGPSFQSHQVDHPQYHDRIVEWLEGSYLANYSATRKHLASLALNLGLSMNDCIS